MSFIAVYNHIFFSPRYSNSLSCILFKMNCTFWVRLWKWDHDIYRYYTKCIKCNCSIFESTLCSEYALTEPSMYIYTTASGFCNQSENSFIISFFQSITKHNNWSGWNCYNLSVQPIIGQWVAAESAGSPMLYWYIPYGRREWRELRCNRESLILWH